MSLIKQTLARGLKGAAGGGGTGDGYTSKTVAQLQTYKASDHVGQVIKVTDLAEAPNTFTWAYSSGSTWKSVYSQTVISTDPIVPIEPTSVSVLPSPITIAVGATQQLTATVLPANATNKNVTWSTSDSTKATVSNTGLVTGIRDGMVDIICTTVLGGKTTTVSTTVIIGKQIKAVGRWNLAYNGTVDAPAGKTTVVMPLKLSTGSGDVDGIYLQLPGWYIDFQNTGMATDMPNDKNVLEHVLERVDNQANVLVKVNGSSTFVIPKGGDVFPDRISPESLGFTNGKIPVGTEFWSKMKFTVPEGGKVMKNLRIWYGQGNIPGWFYDPSVTTVPSMLTPGVPTQSGTAAAGIESPYGPFLLGTFVDPAMKAACIAGDSIGAGQADSSFGLNGMGWAQRVLGMLDVPMASVNVSCPGAIASSVLNDPRVTKLMAMGPDLGIFNFGTNNGQDPLVWTPAQTVAQIQQQVARYKNAAGVSPTAKAIVACLLPRTYDPAQAYTSDAAQTVYTDWGANGFSVTTNNLIKAAGFDVVLDQDGVRSVTDPLKWGWGTGPVGYAFDGTHLKAAGNVKLATDALTKVKNVLSGAAFTGKSLSMNFTTAAYQAGQPPGTVTLASLASATRAGATAMYYGTDGLLKTAAADTLRVGTKGLLVEKAVTNLNPRAHPGLYDTGGPGLTGTPNGAIGLDGTMSAFLTALDTATTQQNVGIPANTDAVMVSVILRPETANTGRFYMPQMGMYYEAINAADDTSYYDFSTKTFGAGCKGNWKAEEFTAAGFTWTKLTFLAWNTGQNSLCLLTPKNNTVNRCIIDNVFVGNDVYDFTPVRSNTTRNADSVLIANGAWTGAQGYITVDCDNGVNVELTSNGIVATGYGYIRSIEYNIGVPPVNKMAGGLVMMNLSAAGFGDVYSEGSWPGVLGTDYEYPAKQYFDRWKAEGMTCIRLPFEWTRLQKTLNGALDTAEVAAITACLDIAAANGQRIVLDLHNYFARYMPNGNGTNTQRLVGSAELPESALLDVWTRIVNQWKNHAGLMGWCFMNEPYGTNGAWAATVQKLINQTDTIEAATATPVNYKFINGDGYSGTANWYQQNAAYFPLKGKNLVYEGHFYLDSTNQGLYNDLSEVVPADRGTSRVLPWTVWLERYNLVGYIGEVGWPVNMSTTAAQNAMNTAAANVVNLLAGKNIPITYFAGGPRWNETHPLAIEYQGVIRNQIIPLRAVQKTVTKWGPKGN